MSLTLRRLQKMFSASARGIAFGGAGGLYDEELGRLGAFISGNNRWRRADVTATGCLHNQCNCPDCRTIGRDLGGVRNLVDRWVREYGPDIDVDGLIAAEHAKRMPPQPQPQQKPQPQANQNQQGQPQQGPPQQASGQPQAGNGQGSGQSQPTGQQPQTRTQPTGPASDGNAEPPRTQPQSQPTPAPAPPQPSPEQKALEAAKKELREAIDVVAKKELGKKSASRMVRTARRKLKQARKAASYNKDSEGTAVSLSSRMHIAKANGRLQRVPQKLRNRMADLINRLVEQGGAAGENLSPIPVLSATKLVKRLVVRRPLTNAFKEDTIIGRPVVLFLPDVSPSCRKQAQVACDLANAAGYAGVSGSDVLVLPHSNGQVDADEAYIPWFNGHPVTTDLSKISRIFNEVCGGLSEFRVRVVVFLGDHDAVRRYGLIADLRSVTRVLWLHNVATRGSYPEPADRRLLPQWSAGAIGKLSMVAGCVDQPRMLTGFDMALKMKR